MSAPVPDGEISMVAEVVPGLLVAPQPLEGDRPSQSRQDLHRGTPPNGEPASQLAKFRFQVLETLEKKLEVPRIEVVGLDQPWFEDVESEDGPPFGGLDEGAMILDPEILLEPDNLGVSHENPTDRRGTTDPLFVGDVDALSSTCTRHLGEDGLDGSQGNGIETAQRPVPGQFLYQFENAVGGSGIGQGGVPGVRSGLSSFRPH